jgi:hypothetical protein
MVEVSLYNDADGWRSVVVLMEVKALGDWIFLRVILFCLV